MMLYSSPAVASLAGIAVTSLTGDGVSLGRSQSDVAISSVEYSLGRSCRENVIRDVKPLRLKDH
eukprot:3185213-Pyramimonas_sp.AAC.2